MVKYKGMKNTKYGKLAWLVLLITMFSILFIPNIANQKMKTESEITNLEVEKIEEVVVPEIPQILLDIAWCESKMSQDKKGYNYRYKIVDGEKVKYLWSTDIGYWQINDYYHEERAYSLGFNIYTYEGNRDYALLLYNENGVKDWKASSACWSDIEAWKAKHKTPYYQ